MIELIKNEKNQAIGWTLVPKTLEEQELAGTIRDLQFFGFDDTKIVYNGITLHNEKLGKVTHNLKSVSWIQKKYEK